MYFARNVCGVVFVMLLVLFAAGCGAPAPDAVSNESEISVVATKAVVAPIPEEDAVAPNVIWNEGEDFATAPPPTEMSREHELPASGSKVLNRGALDVKDNVVTYQVGLSDNMANAKIVFRYARPWLRHVPTTPVKVTLAGPLYAAVDRPLAAESEVYFKNTSSWGARPIDHDLLTVDVGDLAKGTYSLKLTALADNGSLTIDGFFVASGNFKISMDELDRLIRVKIAPQGYAGLRRASIVVRQDAEKVLTLTARSFDPAVDCEVAEAVIKNADDTETALAVGSSAVKGEFNLDVSALADGDYVLTVRMKHPASELTTPLLLAGKLLGGLDENLARLKATVAKVKTSEDASVKRCELDLEQAVEFLSFNKSRLMAATSLEESVRKDSMKDFVSYVRDPEALLKNMRRTVAQSLETMERLDAGKDPYDGRFGDMRRAYRAVSSGKVEPYRVFVPTSYATADKVPLILMLHGAGDDENYFPDLDSGAILPILEKRGYMAVMPKWHSGPVAEDMPKLLEDIFKEYPKVDQDRVYCTGLSMGGFGTYRLGAAHPELFAAIAPTAGTGSLELAPNFKNLPVIIFQG